MVMPKWPVNKVWVRLIITATAWVDTKDEWDAYQRN